MKIFEGMQSFFESLGEYAKNFSTMFWVFLGAFILVSVVIVIITSFAYECKLTKTIDKINKFLERNPRINDDNLVAFNNLMKANSVPKTLRRQWQQFMLYREHPASYYMSFKHCVENPLRNSTYRQQMTVYKIISYVLVVLSLVVSAFMATNSYSTNLTLQDVLVIPISILVLYWLVSMILDLVHSAVSGDLFQNYQYFEINMDKAMLTLPEFVDYEVLFSQDEIRRGIPVLFAYLQKRAIQEQQELEKARLKSVDHEKFDFDEAGLDGSLVLDRAMRETENYTTQRKKYMQETERVNNEISVLENNYKEQMKEFQRQVQTSKETVENLKEQLEQASSTIEINYIKKQMRDEINRQQLAEKDFDILTDKHNQEIKTLNQEIKHYEEETRKAKEAMEVAMLSEFNTYSIKVYDNLEKIVDEKMQDRVDDYKDQIKDLEIELEEKNEELENVYTRYQEVLAQVPAETEPQEEYFEEVPAKKSKKKKKSSKDDLPADDGMVQPEQLDQYDDQNYGSYDAQNYDIPNEFDQYDAQNYDNSNDYGQYDEDYNTTSDYDQYNENYGDDNGFEQYDNQQYGYEDQAQYGDIQDYNDIVDQAYQTDEYSNENYNYDQDLYDYNSETPYVPMDNNEFADNGQYVPTDNYEYDFDNAEQYVPLQDESAVDNQEYVPLQDQYEQSNADYNTSEEYVPLNDYSQDNYESGEYVPLNNEEYNNYYPMEESVSEKDEDNSANEEAKTENNDFAGFDDSDFDIDFNKEKTSDNFDDMQFDFDFGENTTNDEPKTEVVEEVDDSDFDLNKVLGLYDTIPTKSNDEEALDKEEVKDVEDESEDAEDNGDKSEEPVVVKRKAGRPRKIVDESEIKPKRKPGRPRKVVDETEIKPKRKAGRPRKIIENVEAEPKRKAGRPKKEVAEVLETPKRKPGRPRKDDSKIEVVVKEPKRRGRPRKTENTQPVAKKTTSKRGRPRKDNTNKGVIDNKGVLGKPKRKAGRPRKNAN